MTSPMSNIGFHFMAAAFWFRYRSRLPADAIADAGVKPGDTVLDFGCGPGGFAVQAARTVGKAGKVFALDIKPVAAAYVARRAKREGISNIKTITSGLKTGLADESVDVILLYDIFHHLDEPRAILTELNRVLAGDGVLSVSDHHLKQDEIVAGITESGLFLFEGKGARTYAFSKGRKR